MAKKLFVSNLDFKLKVEELEALFHEVGPTESVVIAQDKATNRSRGFGFVEMKNDEDAQKAIEVLTNRELNGRPIRVVESRNDGGGGGHRGGGGGDRPRRDWGNRDGGHRGGGGGHRGGGGGHRGGGRGYGDRNDRGGGRNGGDGGGNW